MQNLLKPRELKLPNMAPIGHMIVGATLLIILGFATWATINADVLWKAMRYPEAVRQMQVEIVVKK